MQSTSHASKLVESLHLSVCRAKVLRRAQSREYLSSFLGAIFLCLRSVSNCAHVGATAEAAPVEQLPLAMGTPGAVLSVDVAVEAGRL